ncbi:aminoglycoside phosphotransferase family protein, partial [Streptomyces sp. B1866]|uniref:aminoglycoside phosphotransferase family protein n=1 Tax=Streptomyces sp. B1866 TaxID=3075431 RepID=UPI00288CA6F4
RARLEAAGAVRRLWVAPGEGHPFGSVARRTAAEAEALRARAADAGAPPPAEALAVREELVARAPEAVLLHGDFRQGKVLAGTRAPWLAVGPVPLVGERAYDVAGLVLDRCEDLVAEPGGAAEVRRRVARLADALEVDRERLRGWALFRAVAAGLRAAAPADRR